MKNYLLFLSLLTLLFSCNNIQEKNNEQAKGVEKDTISKQPEIDSTTITPIFGYRFQVLGDYDGDGIQDSLTEHFYSKRDNKETNKYFSGIEDVWVLYDSVYNRDCISYLKCNKAALDTIPVSGIFGPMFLRNEGDLDMDGGDEISYVPSIAQQSSVNHCHIVSFKNGRWKEIFSFVIREWQIPPLPQAGKTYGLFGMAGAYIVGDNDTLNQKMEKDFNEFPGFITKLKSGKIRVETFTEMADDTTIVVDLKKHLKPFN